MVARALQLTARACPLPGDVPRFRCPRFETWLLMVALACTSPRFRCPRFETWLLMPSLACTLPRCRCPRFETWLLALARACTSSHFEICARMCSTCACKHILHRQFESSLTVNGQEGPEWNKKTPLANITLVFRHSMVTTCIGVALSSDLAVAFVSGVFLFHFFGSVSTSLSMSSPFIEWPIANLTVQSCVF